MQEYKNIQVCPACGVKIVGGDKVLFSVGAPGTRSRLYARVCQYAKKAGCINRNTEEIGQILPSDYYGDIEETNISAPKSLSLPVTALVSGMLRSKDSN